jgi:hypothetical protein
VILGATATLATLLPAVRAATSEPLLTLRQEERIEPASSPAARSRFTPRLLAGGGPSAPNALGKLPAARLAIPFLERLVRDLSLDEQLREFPPLSLTLERHNTSCASKRRARMMPMAG